MPELLLPVRHFRQNSEASCLAACARTVMAYTGDVRSEEMLVELFDIDMAFGAPASRLLRLSRWGYQVDYDLLPSAASCFSRSQRSSHCPDQDRFPDVLGGERCPCVRSRWSGRNYGLSQRSVAEYWTVSS